MKIDRLRVNFGGEPIDMRGLSGEPDELATLVRCIGGQPADTAIVEERRHFDIDKRDIIAGRIDAFPSVVELEIDGAHLSFNCWALDELATRHWRAFRGPVRGEPPGPPLYGRIWNDAIEDAIAALRELSDHSTPDSVGINDGIAALARLLCTQVSSE